MRRIVGTPPPDASLRLGRDREWIEVIVDQLHRELARQLWVDGSEGRLSQYLFAGTVWAPCARSAAD
jgi:hypothetical protein